MCALKLDKIVGLTAENATEKFAEATALMLEKNPKAGVSGKLKRIAEEVIKEKGSGPVAKVKNFSTTNEESQWIETFFTFLEGRSIDKSAFDLEKYKELLKEKLQKFIVNRSGEYMRDFFVKHAESLDPTLIDSSKSPDEKARLGLENIMTFMGKTANIAYEKAMKRMKTTGSSTYWVMHLMKKEWMNAFGPAAWTLSALSMSKIFREGLHSAVNRVVAMSESTVVLFATILAFLGSWVYNVYKEYNSPKYMNMDQMELSKSASSV